MREGIKKLYHGDFNIMSQETLSDDSIIVILSKNNEKKSYKFRVKNLYKKDEVLLEEEIIEDKPSSFILERMKEK